MVVFKRRYLLMEILLLGTPWPDLAILTPSILGSIIQESMEVNFGEHGLSSIINSMQVKYLNPVTGLCLVRCSRDEYHRLWCAITFVSSIRNQPVLFNLLDLSGNIKTSRKTLVKLEQEKLTLLKLQSKEPLSAESGGDALSVDLHFHVSTPLILDLSFEVFEYLDFEEL
ncbi:hypothetical protein R1flu_003801 [Riccia fluitans]|uniref:Uncharacterized protein n=1 Tax=Riccia fluitans TaxID=41844 RepID=A0ABD1YAC9_9MARC